MKTFLLTLLTITSFSSISLGQAPPTTMVMTNTTHAWSHQFNHSLDQTTTDITGARPDGATYFPTSALSWLFPNLPSGTKFHTYNSEELVETGALAGKPKMSMQIIEFPDGTTDLASVANRLEGNGIVTATFSTHLKSPPSYSGFDYQGGVGSIYSDSFAIVYPGGGFGPAYTPSMALPLASTMDLVAIGAMATVLEEGLEFHQGYWRPVNP